MIIPKDVSNTLCDCCDQNIAGFAAIAQGATGRFCEVMWICDECADEMGDIWTREEAIAYVEKQPGATVDF